MKPALIGGVALGLVWVGGAGPCSALPVFSPQPIAEAQTALLLARHHRHHHHWRHHSRQAHRSRSAPEEPYPSAVQDETTASSASRPPEMGSAQPPTAEIPAETAPSPRRWRSTRWINPDRRRR
jgi:hypothetical protein